MRLERFSCVRLRCGVQRRIGLLSRPGDNPALVIVRFDTTGRCIGKTVFRRPHEVLVLADAIRAARDPSLRGRVDTGILDHGADLRLHVWASSMMGKPAAVCFARRTRAGEYIGGVTSIDDPHELDALEAAMRRLMKMIERTPARCSAKEQP